MTRILGPALIGCFVALGCAPSPDGSAIASPARPADAAIASPARPVDVAVDASGDPPAPPVVGGIGAAECEDDGVCRAQAEAAASALTEPAPFDRATVASRCVYARLSEGGSAYPPEGKAPDGYRPTCLCIWDATNPDAAFHEIGDHGRACFAFGRANQCLFTPADFLGCDPDEPDSSCDDDCAVFDAARKADAEASYEAVVVRASCDSFTCLDVTRIEGQCYAEGQRTPYDCELGPDAILEMAIGDANTSVCNADECDGGGV